MAFDSAGKGAAKGYQWLQEMRLKSAQLASSNAQAAQRAELQQQQMAQQERMQTERLDAAAAERQAMRLERQFKTEPSSVNDMVSAATAQ